MWNVYLKELLELLRDKKTLIFTVLLPTLIMPVIFIGLGWFTASMQIRETERELAYDIINADAAPDLVNALSLADNMRREPLNDRDATEAIRAEEIDFVLEIPEDYATQSDALNPVTLGLRFNGASATSRVYPRVEAALEKPGENLRQQRLERVGLSSEEASGLIEPLKLERRSTADRRESIGEQLGGFLPYLLIIVCLSGATYPALDLGVGEKERGTLETLLLTPVPRWQLVMAKFLVLFTTSLLAVFLTLTSMGVFMTVGFNILEAQGLDLSVITQVLGSIGITELLVMLLMLLPTAATFSALLLMVSFYARNYKEAQNYLSPLMLTAFIPVIIAIMPGVSLNWKWAMVPLTNVALAIKELLKGTMDYGMIAVIFASSAVIAGAMVSFTVYLFQRESVLFRT
jgi:sodium transport system permease protein